MPNSTVPNTSVVVQNMHADPAFTVTGIDINK